jgi:hypothetical protein
MKVKLLNVLTVCVVTLTVLSPTLVVCGVIWGRHTELVKTQNLPCEVNKINSQSDITSLRQMQSGSNILQWLLVLTPICLGLGIIGYERYLVYRAAVFQAQVEMLERLWQQHSIEQ